LILSSFRQTYYIIGHSIVYAILSLYFGVAIVNRLVPAATAGVAAGTCARARSVRERHQRRQSFEIIPSCSHPSRSPTGSTVIIVNNINSQNKLVFSFLLPSRFWGFWENFRETTCLPFHRHLM
jgi:hypothetical protein